jgi:RHS repeat-associated protein
MKLLKGILTFLFLWINTIIIKADTSPIKGYAPIQKIIIIHPSTTTKIIFTTTPLQTNPIKNFATLRKKGVCGQKKCIDLYSGGMPMPGRTYNGNDYRYGFNGKENDPETGGRLDYGLRIYDPNTGKFLSVDPVSNEFPWNSTYSFAENDVIRCIDLEGAEKRVIIYHWYGDGFKVAFDGPPTADQSVAQVAKKVVLATGLNDDGTLVFFQKDIKVNSKVNPDETIQNSVTVFYDYQYLAKNEGGEFQDVRGKSQFTTKETDPIGLNIIKDIQAIVNFRVGLNKQNKQNSNSVSIPEAAKTVVEYAKNNKGGAQPGFKGGRKFANDGRDGGQVLQSKDSNGNPITYKEYDINPKVEGKNRGTERVVIGSDNKSYYTDDHYKTFKEIKPVEKK